MRLCDIKEVPYMPHEKGQNWVLILYNITIIYINNIIIVLHYVRCIAVHQGA